MATLISYWPLNETSGTVAADSLGVSTGAYVGSPTLGAAGHIFGASNGGNAVATTAGSPGAYVSLGMASTLNTDITKNGMTLCFWFRDAGIPATAGPHYIAGSYEDASTRNGFDLSINNSTGVNGGLTLTVVTPSGSTHARQWKRGAGESPLCDGEWHHVCIRAHLSAGASSSAGTLSVAIDGIPLKVSSAWTDVATDATVGATMTDRVTTPVVLGGRSLTGGTTTTSAGYFQRVRQYAGLLTDEELIDLIRSETNSAGVGCADAFCEFAFDSIADLFQDTAGTTPVTAAGQNVRRVNARNFGGAGTAWYLTSASAGTSPVWNGSFVETGNHFGSSSAWRGWTLNGHTATKFRQFRMSCIAVVSQVGPLVVPSDVVQTVAVMRGAGSSAFAFLTYDGQPAVATGTFGSTRVPASASTMEVLKNTPSWSLVAGSTGSNGSGAEGDGTDFCFVSDDSVRGNTSGTAINGSWNNVLTSASSFVGVDDALGNAGLAAGAGFAGLWRKLVILNRPIHPTAEAPYLRARAVSAYASLSRSDMLARVVVLGDSISYSNNTSNPLGGYQAMIGGDFDRSSIVTNVSFSGASTAQIDTMIAGSAKWAAGWPTNCPRLAILFLGTNDIINAGVWVNQTTLEARITSIVASIRSRFGASVPIIAITPRTGFTNALTPPASTAALVTFYQANPSLYTRLILSGSYDSADGTHPSTAGHAAIAAQIRSAVLAVLPQAVGATGRAAAGAMLAVARPGRPSSGGRR